MIERSTEWDHNKLDLILPVYKQLILTIKPSVCNAPDELVWLKTSSGSYSTKSGYRAQSEACALDDPIYPTTHTGWFANVWDLKVSEKIKVFLWNVLHDGLPVGEQFAIRNIPISSQCPRCTETESVVHLLFNCRYAKDVWDLVPFALPADQNPTISTAYGPIQKNPIPPPPTGLEAGTLSSWILWNIWIARNQPIFNKQIATPIELVTKAIKEAREWTTTQSLRLQPLTSKPSIAEDPTSTPNRACMFTDAAWDPLTKRA